MKKLIPFFLLLLIFQACKKNDKTEDVNNQTPDISNIYGYSILEKLPGIWSGPLSSTTSLGSFPDYTVDFRPISASQISAKNELDKNNDIHLSFFVTLYNQKYSIAFKNGGYFAGMSRISYFIADSVSETAQQSYYRFAEIIKGKNRAYTELIFRNDSMIFQSYTNKYNTQGTATLHMSWQSTKKDTTSTVAAKQLFQFPAKSLTKDLSQAFSGMSESIFYTLNQDPYNEAAQPHLGKSTLSYSFGSGFSADTNKSVFLFVTTKPLFNGFVPDMSALNTRCRYVVVKASQHSFEFNYMHPGSYFLYALYDADGNGVFSTGDWVSATNQAFTLNPKSTVQANTQINFSL